LRKGQLPWFDQPRAFVRSLDTHGELPTPPETPGLAKGANLADIKPVVAVEHLSLISRTDSADGDEAGKATPTFPAKRTDHITPSEATGAQYYEAPQQDEELHEASDLVVAPSPVDKKQVASKVDSANRVKAPKFSKTAPRATRLKSKATDISLPDSDTDEAETPSRPVAEVWSKKAPTAVSRGRPAKYGGRRLSHHPAISSSSLDSADLSDKRPAAPAKRQRL
jgi:hypothetical protein